MLQAIEAGSGFEDLRDLTQRLLDEGVPSDVLLDDLGQIRGLVTDEQEESVLDVMDLLVGWCAPSAKLTPNSGDK
jgi:hypothetical protein